MSRGGLPRGHVLGAFCCQARHVGGHASWTGLSRFIIASHPPDPTPIAIMRFPEFPDDPEHAPVSPDERHQAGQRSTWVSVWVNVLLSAGQMVVGLLAHSQALVADALHSLSDLVSDGVVLVASHHSRKDADEDHPYGHHRFETAASLALGLILLGVGGGMLWAAVLKLQAPDQISPVQPLALYVALVAIISKELLFRYLQKVATRSEEHTSELQSH